MRSFVLRLSYRLAAPLARAWFALWGTPHVGAKCVVTHAGELLLVRHTYGDRRRWDFPGGFVRAEEDAVAGAGRELREELGLAVGAHELERLGELELRLCRRTDTIHYFRLELAGRAVVPDRVELAEVGWFPRAALPIRLGTHVQEVLDWIGPGEPLASSATNPGSPDDRG